MPRPRGRGRRSVTHPGLHVDAVRVVDSAETTGILAFSYPKVPVPDVSGRPSRAANLTGLGVDFDDLKLPGGAAQLLGRPSLQGVVIRVDVVFARRSATASTNSAACTRPAGAWNRPIERLRSVRRILSFSHKSSSPSASSTRARKPYGDGRRLPPGPDASGEQGVLEHTPARVGEPARRSTIHAGFGARTTRMQP